MRNAGLTALLLIVGGLTGCGNKPEISVTVTFDVTEETYVGGESPILDVPPATDVELDASGSTDPDGDALSYIWSGVTQEAGDVLTGFDGGAVLEFTTGSVDDVYYGFEVKVFDGRYISLPVNITLAVTSGGSAPRLLSTTMGESR